MSKKAISIDFGSNTPYEAKKKTLKYYEFSFREKIPTVEETMKKLAEDIGNEAFVDRFYQYWEGHTKRLNKDYMFEDYPMCKIIFRCRSEAHMIDLKDFFTAEGYIPYSVEPYSFNKRQRD